MEYRALANTGLSVSAIGFGGHAIGGNAAGDGYGHTDDDESRRAIIAAWEHGCNLFDTASVYGDGHSERLIGEALRMVGAVHDAVIVSKAGSFFDGEIIRADYSDEALVKSVEGSLRRLGRDHLDVLLLHNPDSNVVAGERVFDCLDRLQLRGKIRHYGVSVHSVEEALTAAARPRVAALQIVYNMLAHLHPAASGAGLLDVWTSDLARRVGLMAREPLGNGFLSGKYAELQQLDPTDVRRRIPERDRQFRTRSAEILRRQLAHGVTTAQGALRFVLDERRFATTIVGMKTVRQVEENCAAASLLAFEDLLRVARTEVTR
ncbi:aldo/keto reductase [Bradyrhizobium brasilense]|uniref:aldo/keto reductase n=1 Tax=Bradyrhizobium brasilense TaxID=1419277 RepID=UPI001E36C0A4|nr:aldo/keto reductase [Bradyrhizobium brasilense]MCC8969771.1 aldo/keto reductase [Bradyrhizobium brasilense]